MKKYPWILITLVFLAAFSRLVPHPDNFTSLTVLSLLGVSYLKKATESFCIPLAALFLSDCILGFYPYMWAVYVAFMLVSVVGFFVMKKLSYLQKLLFLIPASLFFFFFTNTAFFFQGNFYPQTMQGYIACLVAGIPFLRNALLGDAFYGILFFGAAELVYRERLIKSAYFS
jgi:hypothetical protein